MKIITKLAGSFAISVSVIALLVLASYNMEQNIMQMNERNDLMYAPATRTLIMMIDDFTLLQDIIQYNPDAYARNDYVVTFDRLMGHYDDYRGYVNAKGSDGKYFLSDEERREFLGYTNEMEKNTVLFDGQARRILDVREDLQLSQEEKQRLVAGIMPLAEEPMWQFWYYLDVAKDTMELEDLEQRQENLGAMSESHGNMTLLLTIGTVASAGIAVATLGGFTRRIRCLSRSAELIGKQDYSEPVQVTGKDEMTLLARDFEEMRQRVQSYDHRLTMTVKERTIELENANAKLRRQQKELELTNRLLKESEKMKDEFINVAAHELRTPIQPILTYGELAQEGVVSQQDAWAVVIRQANRLKNLANDILDVSRIDGGKLVLKKMELDINELVRNLPKATILEKGVVLELRLQATEGVKVVADESRILQVLTNLVSNSAKFTRKGAITVETQLVNGSVALTVTDTGPGIPDEILPKLFTKFATKDIETSKNGTGLGLYICKGIIEAHGGAIQGSNIKGGGAMFRFVLPLKGGGSRLSDVPEIKESHAGRKDGTLHPS